MVRETRHLWVGNLPENIREDRIREHFKRYGRVQSVKLLPRGEECPVDGGSSSSLGESNEGGSGSSSGGGSGGGGGGSSTSGGASATVAFMDIKSAAKAHATEHTLDERALTTQYYEPQHLQHRFPSHGSSEDHGSGGGSGGGGSGTGGVSGGGGGGGGSTGAGIGGSGGGGERGDRGSENFDSRGSHGSFYGSERSNRVVGTGNGGVVGGGGGGGSGGGGVGGHSADPSTGDPGGYISRSRPPPGSSYHVTSSRARDRLYPRTGPYVSGPPPPPHLDRHRGSLPPSSWSTYEPTSSRYGGAPPPPSPATNDAYQDEQGGGGGGGGSGSTGALRQHKKQRRKSRSGSSSPSGSSRSGSSSSSRSGSSGGSTSGGSTSPGSSPHRTSNVAVTEDRRPLAICVRNLPARSSDTSLKDGLFHEYKKHGKVTWVKVVGAAGDRYALVCFKKPEDVEKALEVSQDKLFFGCKIEVAPYQGYDVEDNEFRPYEAELDEYHPKATRTLFIGNLEKDVTASELRKHFEPFGEIIEIDIKKQGAVSSYAFCQYSDIGSVVKAMRSMDGEHLGANRIKLGFGKSMPTSCVWVDGIGDCMSEKYLNMQFHQFGPITQVVVDRERGHALVFFDQISCAQAAVKEMRGAALRGRRLQVDFASRECQETFYEHLERQGNASEKPWDSRPSPASSFDVTIPSRRERSSFDSAVTVSSSSNRFTRYDTPPRSRTANYSRTSGGSTPGASPAHPTAMSRSSRRSYQDSYYDDYGEPTSRRFRSYDEFSQGSGASHDDYQSSVLSDGKLNEDDCPPPSRRHTVQSVVTSVDPPAPPPPLLPPPDIRHLQKERVHLLEQLEECHSSGDEVGFVPKKRAKLDSSSTTILCEDDEPEIASLLVTSHSSRKGMDFRRVSDSKIVVHHSTRRGSCEGRGPGPCKRRRDATSRHHEHHDGSRPGTPLVDERPENLVPSEPRRFRERSHEGPLSLPLPRFAAQMLNNNNNTSSSNNNNGSSTRSSSASLAKVASPPCASLSTAPSPRAAPQPPASPPPRHASSSPTSSDSETAPQSPSLEERIRSLDEKYEKWSGSRALSAAGGDALAKLDASASERFRFRHKLLDMDLHEVQPSDIVKSVLAKRSVFDEDSKRLENFSEKYEPREFTGVIGVSSMIGSTAGLTSSGSCTSKVCLQYPFPSHPPVQPTSGTSVSQVGINTSLSASSLTATTTSMASSMLKTDPRMVQHNCIHPTPATPITPGTSIKTVSPELPPVSLPIGLVSGTAANSGNGGLASASSLLSSGSIGSIHTLGASTHRGLSISATTASPTVTAASTDAFSTAITTAVPVATTPSTVAATTTMSVTGAISSMTTTSSIAPPSSITSSSNSSSSSSLSTSSTDLTRSRLRKETSSSSRESRDPRDGKDSREKHGKGKDCQRRSRKEEVDVERNRKDRDERESSNVMNDIGNTDNHSRDFKENKELRYERKEREEKERRDKEDRDRQERRDKEDRDRQEKKEREERERREKDEERRERERQDKERLEKDRREREERERERKEREENELKEKERREKERIDRERREREEKERQERREREERERREREERERKEREIRLEREKQEKERLKKEREEQERKEKEERDRLERERRREEKERLERERKREREEKERLERERRKDKEEREKMEKEKREKEERERLEKLEREKHEREKRREREDQERREKEKAEREKRRDRDEKDKEKRERDDSRRQSTENHLHPSITQSQNQIAPAPVPIKRRCSSQDCPTDEDAKRVKLSDHRRDSKDRSRQNRRSEDRKHRNDSHRSSRESRESRDSKESSSVTQDSRDGTHGESTRENNSRDSGNKEKQRSKRNRSEKESRERSPRVSHESDKEFLSRLELSKRNDSSPSTEQSVGTNHRDAQHHQQSTVNSHSDMDDGLLSTHEIQVARNPSATDTDSDEPKKHSIFDIVDDEPAYISMYDKVKARSTKNMQKLEEEKRQVRLKDKFSQLKQSRARREEKKQSTSWDGDSVSSKALTEDEATSESDSTRTKSLSRKGSRSRIHSDTSEEEEPFNNKVRKPVKTERFLESDVDLGFADTEEKQNPLEASNVIVNSVHTNIKEEPRTSDEDERLAVGFRTNHPTIVVNNHERDPRKKSHKKKQKRQKNSISSEDNLKVEPNVEHKNKVDVITSNADCRPNHGTELTTVTAATTIVTTALENAEERMRVDKKQRSKKEKKRDRNGEDKAKARRKRLNRQEARDSQRMEDIFGPLSDDVDDGPSNNTFFNRFGNMTSENSAYASDSDGGRSSLDMDRVRRKTEKKRRHQPEDENSVDLAEAGREIEAKLLGIPSSPKTAPACTAEPNDHDVFRFTDDNDSVEPSTPSTVPEKVKEKKKKRKKSKEERGRKDYHHHHHHHHHHHEKSGELPYLGAEPSPPRASSPLVSKTISPSLPTPRETLLSPIPKVTSNVPTVPSITPPVVTGSIQTPKSEKKKDKLIPGFGIEIDETIHENAVKSISEPDERDSSCQSRSGREEPEVSVSTTPPAQSEDKPRVAISQEETEDAVAALLEETFGASTEDFSYEGEEEEAEADGVAGTPAEAPQEDVEEMQQAVESLNASTGEGDADLKPDTPQSEHDLQIDTDTEEDPNYETVDLTQPPKTPDIPSFYKSPTKTLPVTPVLATPEKPVEVRLPPTVTKPQSPPTSVIAHSWSLNEHNKSREPVKSHQLKTNELDADVESPERTAQAQRTSASPPPPQYKQPMLVPCSVPITSDVPKSLSIPSSRPSPITVQPLYQRLPVSPQSQMVPMRQASPKMQNVTTVSCSSSSNTPLPPLVPSRMPPLVPSQPSPRVSQPLSPNGQWSRNPTLNPHVPNMGKRKSSPPPTKIAVCVPIPAHRPETPVQQIYSTAATQQPVIQHASGMLAPAPGYPRGGLPPLTLNIPPRPYMPVPPLASGIQVKNSRDASLGGKSVIETLLPVNPNEPSQRLDEPKLSPAVIPESTNKASTSPKVPSPNQPPTYIPETAKIEINASTSSPVFGKPAYVTDNYTMSSRTQKQISVSITDSNLLSPRQKQEVSNLQLLTTHVPRSSTPSPVIVAHGQSHLLHKSVHSLGPPTVSSPNQPLIKTVVPIVPQQVTSNAAPSMPSDKCVIPQTPVACQRQSPVSQSQVVKSHVPLVSTVSQTIITRVVSSTVPSMSTPPMNEQITPECLDSRIMQGQQLELDAEAQISQTVQPMQLTPPIQPTQPIDEIKKEPADLEQEDTVDEAAYNVVESEKSLCIKEEDVKQEKQEIINSEIAPCTKVEPVDMIVPKLETETPVKLEPVNEMKEEEAVKETDEVELDEEPVEDPLKEPSTDPLAIDSKEDPTDSKEDSDYWSAKEVNIESVIKKVDALCDGEGNDGDDEAQQGNESVNSDSHDTSKNESDWFDTESTEGESKKNFISADDHDESVETCENECTRSRRGRTKSRRGSRGGVTTRRGGRNASTISHRRGGRSSRGSKHHVEKNKLPADVYEFHDDSEEDNAGRPRLILTIKSPGPNVTGPNAQPATPVAAVKEVPPEEFVSPAANTRKSRRLAERDGSRNTIDDVIEDVVRGSPANKGLISGNAGNVHATRRSTRHNNIPRSTAQQPIVPLTELRKSPRSGRKAVRRTSENNDDSGEEKMKEVTATPQEVPSKEETKLVQPESPKAEEPAQAVTTAPLKTVSHEPMALIDPVTGMLIPMRESEEGQYIPVSTTSGQAQATNRALSEARSGGLPGASPTNEAPRAKPVSESSVLVPAEPIKEAVIEHCQPTPTQQIQPQTSVITKPQSPAVQVTSTITVAQSSTTGTTIVTTVTTTTAPTTTAQPVSTSPSQAKPTSLKAHVLNASKLVTSAQQQVITKPVAPSLPNQTIVQNIVKPPAQAIQGLNLQIPPGRVVSPSLSPRAKQAASLTPTNGKQGQPMSPVLNNTGAPPNPKQHLLQAAKQQTSTIVNMPQKLPLNIHPASVNVSTPTPRIHQPVSQPTTLKGINGQPHPLNPKTHLLQAVVPPIGTVASSPTQPHLVNPQQISTVVNSVRPPGPKAPTTGPMEPQKVEVPMSGCIMVPTASPQSRSVPMPTYEAPLHGSTGATPPGGQYGLVPPHRSQSPPLPPPAHHHVNTSQSEVVNHYGGLARDHYLHSPMFQYQYLRAQQEALTAPRIAYHIPGTRSPHLPLDPKLEPGIDDSHSPPLELRRGTRTPQDRTTDSPQIAQVYMLHGGMRPLPPPPPQYNTGSNPSLSGAPAGARANFYEPPPAHLHSQYPMAASEAPPEMGRAPTPDRCRKHQVVTPPLYASQVPPQADSFQMLLQRHPVMWQGLLALKNDQAAVQMHFVFGNPRVARDSLPCNSDGSTPPLRIAQRMRLEQTQVEGVARKMQTEDEHCMLLALPCGRDEVDVLQQSKNLQTGFIMYLQQKQAAGIVNIAAPGSQQAAYVVHIFPSCDFARETLARIAPDLHHRVAKIAHLLIVIATV